MKRALSISLAIVTVTGAMASLALGHSGATGIVKERMDVMSDVGKNMKAIAAIMKGEVVFDGSAVKSAAELIAAHADKIPHLFPIGSNTKPSEALPAIWHDWDGFTRLGADLKSTAATLAVAAEAATAPADVLDELKAVGATCKGCHEKFRLAK